MLLGVTKDFHGYMCIRGKVAKYKPPSKWPPLVKQLSPQPSYWVQERNFHKILFVIRLYLKYTIATASNFKIL